jgi:hypothetical protein
MLADPEAPAGPSLPRRLLLFLNIFNWTAVPDFSETLSIYLSINIRMSGKKTAAVTSNTPALKTHMDKSIQIYLGSLP